jgi:hypothetical protein
MLEITKFAVEQAMIDLGMAFRAFFEKRESYPRFTTKDVRDSFCATMGAIKFRCEGRRIRLPHRLGENAREVSRSLFCANKLVYSGSPVSQPPKSVATLRNSEVNSWLSSRAGA